MNVIKSNLVCSLLIFIVGVALCFLYDRENILTVIVYILGALFTATGCVNIISCSISHSRGKTGTISSVVGWIAGLGGIGLGAAMLITPHSFTSILVYVFAALLVLGGLWHLFTLAYIYRKLLMPAWLYIPALVLVIGGVVMFCSESVRTDRQAVVLMSAIGAIIYAIETLLEYIFSRRDEKRMGAEIEAAPERVPIKNPIPDISADTVAPGEHDASVTAVTKPADSDKENDNDSNVIHFTS